MTNDPTKNHVEKLLNKSSKLIMLPLDISIGEVLKYMKAASIHHVVLADPETKEPQMIVCDRDLLTPALKHPRASLDSIKAADFAHPATILSDKQNLNEVLAALKDSDSGAILIKKSNGAYGIITTTDILNLLYQKSVEDHDDPLDFAQYTLSDPLIQNIMKMLSDLGI